MRLEGPVSASSIARVWNLSFRPGEWLLSRFSHLDQTRWPILWVIGLFMVQAVPATILRASNLEEGRIIAIARGAMEDGHWITPFVYGERFAERPVLLSWIAALFGEMTGGVTLWSLRIPHLVFFLSGAILIYSLLRSNAGSKSASIFGALCWLSMPMVAPKFINAEADVVLSTLLFAAFYTWWQATISKHLTLLAWLGIGVLIGLAGLTKGPQPVAYFALGVGAYLLLKDRNQIPAFLAANVLAALMIGGWYAMVYQPNDIDQWMVHSRLLTATGPELVRDHLDFAGSVALEALPATILIGPAIAIVLRTWRSGRHDLMLAATLYSVICTLFLVFWLAASPRAMPCRRP